MESVGDISYGCAWPRCSSQSRQPPVKRAHATLLVELSSCFVVLCGLHITTNARDWAVKNEIRFLFLNNVSE